MKKMSAIIIAVALGILCLSIGSLPKIGDENSAPNKSVTPYYIEHSREDTGSPNIVTGTLADYRGFDTLEETTVMFLAGMTAVLVIAAGKRSKNKTAADKEKAENGKEDKNNG
ncbi:MAG: hypothetical protein HFG67_01345 [Firmicutes bacterium]|nr:hypothetical protein [Bacillota bacterium]